MTRPCLHRFLRNGWAWTGLLPRRRWRCAWCSLETRSYDWCDRAALRPIHRHMTVAVRGYNTTDLVIR